MTTTTDSQAITGSKVTRRRALSLIAASTGLALSGPAAALPAPMRWHGTVLGARSQLLLYGPGERTANQLIEEVLAEARRLERIFSLYQSESALSRLNRDGALRQPPMELVTLLARARFWSEWSGGAFDVTVQPLWQLYHAHFSSLDADPAGPPPSEINRVQKLVDYQSLHVAPEIIELTNRGMAVTLNGIAQGYITDRIADLLRQRGLTQVLVDLGEISAIGHGPNGRPWRIGLSAPVRSGAESADLDIVDRAVATSTPMGTVFDPAGRFHHLLDARNGHPARTYRTATVVARRATDADALSTALIAGDLTPPFEGLPDTIEGVFLDGGEIFLG